MKAIISYIHVYTFTIQNGFSPLYSASEKGHTEVVDILLKHGADPNLATKVWVLVCTGALREVPSLTEITAHIVYN